MDHRSSPMGWERANVPPRMPGDAHQPQSSRRHVESTNLFDGVRELVIAHNGDTYYLRLTRNEKLILTK